MVVVEQAPFQETDGDSIEQRRSSSDDDGVVIIVV
jgi:hypothetical protein